MLRPAISVMAVGLFLAALGCGGNSEPTAGGPPSKPGPPVGAPPSGNDVYDKNCLHCHAYTADNPGPPRTGPTLAKVGASRKADWIADHIKKPQSHKPESKMPEFEKKLSAEELKSVTDYLAGLK